MTRFHCDLGEVALISYDSPINESGILFYNTLFDENASCHPVSGRAYPMNVKGGTEMTHVDFMFGFRDMHIDGIHADGSTATVFDQVSFVR